MRVRFPAASSVGMSRRLLATRIVQVSAPIAMPAAIAGQVIRWVCTYAVPTQATGPKKTNTLTSPSAR